MKTIKYIVIAILLLGQVGCIDKKFEDEFKITISPDAVVNKVNVKVIDLFTFLPVDATAIVSGDNAKYVYSEAGKRTEVTGGYELEVIEGAVSFGVERKANASEENPVKVTLTISATGYADNVIEVTFDGADEAQSYPVALIPSTLPAFSGVARAGKTNDLFGATDIECSVADDVVVFNFTNNSLNALLNYYIYDENDVFLGGGAIGAPVGTFSITAGTVRNNGFYGALKPLLNSNLKLSIVRVDFSTNPISAVSILDKQSVSVCTIVGGSDPIGGDVSSNEATTNYNLNLKIECNSVDVALDGNEVEYRAVGDANFRYFQTIKDGYINGKGPVLEDNIIYQFRVLYDNAYRTTAASGASAIKGSDVNNKGINLDQDGLCEEINKVYNGN
ncbi:hypothetical protein [Wenyingzhuangia sp. IMCC45574]